MTLVNMRENGVRSLSVTCELCHHEVLMNVDAFDDAVLVPALEIAARKSDRLTKGRGRQLRQPIAPR
jgi:hypothetical protein